MASISIFQSEKKEFLIEAVKQTLNMCIKDDAIYSPMAMTDENDNLILTKEFSDDLYRISKTSVFINVIYRPLQDAYEIRIDGLFGFKGIEIMPFYLVKGIGFLSDDQFTIKWDGRCRMYKDSRFKDVQGYTQLDALRKLPGTTKHMDCQWIGHNYGIVHFKED